MHNNTVRTANNHRPDNDNCPVGSFALSFGRSTFPRDAVARIYRPARSAMTSARPRRAWRLSFERRSAPFIEPLMGYTGSRDTLTQVELSFPTREAAIAYAERQGLTYVVQDTSCPDRHDPAARRTMEEQAFFDIVQNRLQHAWLQASQTYGVSARFNDVLDDPESFYTSPMEVVTDLALSSEEKRSVLKNWAWNEYLTDLATAEGKPENNRPSRLDEVEQALLALEREVAADRNDLGTRKAA